MHIILLTEHIPNITNKVKDYLASRYNITDAKVGTRYIRDLPRDDDGYSIRHLQATCITDYYPLREVTEYIDDITDISLIGDVIASEYLTPQITWTDDLAVAQKWLPAIESKYPRISVDFETRDLTLPQLNKVTMVTIGWDLTKSVVIVFKDKQITDYVMDWLVTIENSQVYHNSLFDVRFILNHTGKLPKNIDDSQLLAAVYNNYVNEDKRKVGLKKLAKYPYKDWASDKSSFELYVDSSTYVNPNLNYVGSNPTPHMYNLPLIYYCGVDSCATTFVWQKFDTEPPHPTEWIPQTSEPRDNVEEFNQRYYYEFILKPAIPMVAEMMMNGQAIDLNQVQTILDTVTKLNDKCKLAISNEPLVKKFQEKVDQARIDKFLEPVLKAWKHPTYEKGFVNNVKMRTWIYNYYEGTEYESLKATELKQLGTFTAKLLVDKQFNHPAIIAASNRYYEAEATRQNEQANRIDKVNNPGKYVQLGYNPFNYSQLTDMWISFGLESPEISKDTGKMSFSKSVLTELSHSSKGAIKTILENHLEISESKNMITQYIPKFYGSTIDGRLQYSLRLFGTLSGRLSGKAAKMDGEHKHSTGINGVTLPVGHKVYGKAVKKLLIAPKGKILCYVDYNGLENHISAILTKDPTKLGILNGEYEDMHSLHACYFFKDKIEQQFNVDLSEITKDTVSSLYHNKEFKQIRNDGKPVTFAIDYGAFPPKIAKSAGCSLSEAQGMFDRYHNDLYKAVTKFREEYSTPAVQNKGYLHLNYGLRLYSDDINKDVRTVFNANFQGYTVLTQIAAVEFRKLIIQKGLQDKVKALSIIHDSLTYEVDDDPALIKWVNDTLITLMCKDFVHNQAVKLHAELDIGYNMADMETLSNNASLESVNEALGNLKHN